MGHQPICQTPIRSLVVCKEMWIPWIIHEEEERGQGGFQQDFGAINPDKEDNDHFQEANLHFFKCWRPCQLCSSKCRDHRQAKKVGKVRQVGMQQ